MLIRVFSGWLRLYFFVVAFVGSVLDVWLVCLVVGFNNVVMVAPHFTLSCVLVVGLLMYVGLSVGALFAGWFVLLFRCFWWVCGWAIVCLRIVFDFSSDLIVVCGVLVCVF